MNDQPLSDWQPLWDFLSAQILEALPLRVNQPETHDPRQKGASQTGLVARILREPALRTTVDMICQHLAATGQWPITDTETGLFVWDRFVEGRRVIEEFLTGQAAPQKLSLSQGLEWVLVDWWAFAGCLRWRDSAHLLSGDQ